MAGTENNQALQGATDVNEEPTQGNDQAAAGAAQAEEATPATTEGMATPAQGIENPTSLEEAMLAYRQRDKGQTQSSVENAGSGSAGDQAQASNSEAGQPGQAPAPGDAGTAGVGGTPAGADKTGQPVSQNQPDPNVGGSPIIVESSAVNSQVSQLDNALKQQAVANMQSFLQEKNIRKWGMNDIYERDERTGQVTFRNPDNPNRPFDTRQEAQDWINSMNTEIDRVAQQLANEEYQKLRQSSGKTFEMYDFIDKEWNSMSAKEQDLFDKAVAPYTIYDRTGQNILGYNCDLRQMKTMVQSLLAASGANQPAAAQPAQAQPKQATGPATDMKSSGSTAPTNAEPKNMEEAMRMVMARERAKRNKK